MLNIPFFLSFFFFKSLYQMESINRKHISVNIFMSIISIINGANIAGNRYVALDTNYIL